MSKVNYWGMKVAVIKEMLKEREIDFEIGLNFDRKGAIEALKIDDMKKGDGTELLTEDEDGNLVDVETRIRVVKCRFHNTITDKTPYIYLGHNGKSYYIPKEQDIYVPKFLLDSCIKDAVEIHSDPVTKDGKIQYIERRVQRFPYTELHD